MHVGIPFAYSWIPTCMGDMFRPRLGHHQALIYEYRSYINWLISCKLGSQLTFY